MISTHPDAAVPDNQVINEWKLYSSSGDYRRGGTFTHNLRKQSRFPKQADVNLERNEVHKSFTFGGN